MTVVLKNKWYRINGVLVIEDGRAFMYPLTFSEESFSNRYVTIKCKETPAYITEVDLEIDNIPYGSGRKAHPYIAAIIQGHSGIVYVSSYNSYMFNDF